MDFTLSSFVAEVLLPLESAAEKVSLLVRKEVWVVKVPSYRLPEVLALAQVTVA